MALQKIKIKQNQLNESETKSKLYYTNGACNSKLRPAFLKFFPRFVTLCLWKKIVIKKKKNILIYTCQHFAFTYRRVRGKARRQCFYKLTGGLAGLQIKKKKKCQFLSKQKSLSESLSLPCTYRFPDTASCVPRTIAARYGNGVMS